MVSVGWVLSRPAMIVSSVVVGGSGDSVGEVVACCGEPEGVLLAPRLSHPNEEAIAKALIATKMQIRTNSGLSYAIHRSA